MTKKKKTEISYNHRLYYTKKEVESLLRNANLDILLKKIPKGYTFLNFHMTIRGEEYETSAIVNEIIKLLAKKGISSIVEAHKDFMGIIIYYVTLKK